MKKIIFTLITGVILLAGCAKKEGCTDSKATNYDSAAEKDDGSCTFSTTIDTTTTTTTTVSSVIAGSGATDACGNSYKTVIIGSQEWFAVNLNSCKYNDGAPIEKVTDAFQWKKDTTGAYCYYDNDLSEASKNGMLYNWPVVESGKICPIDWHVPTETDWNELETFLRKNGNPGSNIGLIAGDLKSTSGWCCTGEDEGSVGDSNNGVDFYGFNAFPTGLRDTLGFFEHIGIYASWWSSSTKLDPAVSPSYLPVVRTIDLLEGYLFEDVDPENVGLSIRCIKD